MAYGFRSRRRRMGGGGRTRVKRVVPAGMKKDYKNMKWALMGVLLFVILGYFRKWFTWLGWK